MYLPYDVSKRILAFRGAYMFRDKKIEINKLRDAITNLEKVEHYMNHCENLCDLEEIYLPIRQIISLDYNVDVPDLPTCHCEQCFCYDCEQSKDWCECEE